MKFSNLLGILTCASVASISLPAVALQISPGGDNIYHGHGYSTQVGHKHVQRSTPIAIELAVIFPNTLRLNVDVSQSYPMTLLLAQTVLDAQGNVIAPAQSPVRASVRAVDNGVQITAESIVVAGRSIPISAASSIIPSHTITQQTSMQQGARYSQAGLVIGDSISAIFDADLDTSFQVGSAGKLLGFLVGVSSPEQTSEVTIPVGSVHLMRVRWF